MRVRLAQLAGLGSIVVTGGVVLGQPIITNPSFETPGEGSTFKQAYGGGGGTTPTLANSGYTFMGGGGISGNGSAIASTTAEDGTQFALLQNYNNGAPGPFASSFSQTISGFDTTATYTLSFFDAYRTGNGLSSNPYQVTLTDANGNSTTVFSHTPATTNFTAETTSSFVPGSSTETITFAGLATASDATSYIDTLSISSVPEPASLGLLAVLGAGLLARRRR